ncbi:MAG TPA: MaoC family dehydratase [Rubrivivax sp.]|nr:MaoC family dehydratase [Rubrivivax sp.]
MAAVLLKERWFEDFSVGERFEFGDYLVTAEEIVEFARRYDPQPFHLDVEAAARSHFGGLIASGWMSCSVLMRLVCDHFIPAASSMGSPGIDELRWLKPVRPGDRLRAAVEVVAVKASQSKPDRGVVTVRQELINQHAERMLTLVGRGMYQRRPVG